MTESEALNLLGLDNVEDKEVVRIAYQKKNKAFDEEIGNAPTDAVRSEILAKKNRLIEARMVLTALAPKSGSAVTEEMVGEESRYPAVGKVEKGRRGQKGKSKPDGKEAKIPVPPEKPPGRTDERKKQPQTKSKTPVVLGFAVFGIIAISVFGAIQDRRSQQEKEKAEMLVELEEKERQDQLEEERENQKRQEQIERQRQLQRDEARRLELLALERRINDAKAEEERKKAEIANRPPFPVLRSFLLEDFYEASYHAGSDKFTLELVWWERVGLIRSEIALSNLDLNLADVEAVGGGAFAETVQVSIPTKGRTLVSVTQWEPSIDEERVGSGDRSTAQNLWFHVDDFSKARAAIDELRRLQSSN